MATSGQVAVGKTGGEGETNGSRQVNASGRVLSMFDSVVFLGLTSTCAASFHSKRLAIPGYVVEDGRDRAEAARVTSHPSQSRYASPSSSVQSRSTTPCAVVVLSNKKPCSKPPSVRLPALLSGRPQWPSARSLQPLLAFRAAVRLSSTALARRPVRSQAMTFRPPVSSVSRCSVRRRALRCST